MVEFLVNTKNVKESNIFLRKLWCELNEIRENGWYYSPYKEKNRIYIGNSNFGEISFDYSKIGCIKNIYIDNKYEHEKKLIETALNNAKNNSLKDYTLYITLSEKENTQIENISQDNVSFFNEENNTIIKTRYKAYSNWDLEETIKIKLSSILSILFEYTLLFFEVKKINYTDGFDLSTKSAHENYDYNWIDFDSTPISQDEKIVLPSECPTLISYIINDEYSDINIAHFVNSSRLLFNCAHSTFNIPNPYKVAGFTESLYSLTTSSLEPLSCILDKSVERCEYCGNLKYSIVSKIKTLLTKYFSDDFANSFCKEYYSCRSSYFHEGKINSLLINGRITYPQINPVSQKELLNLYSYSYSNYLFEVSSYVFRNLAHDYFSSNI